MTGLSIQCVVVSCLHAPWGAPHPAWRTAKGHLRPPNVFPRRSHREGAAETAREGWVTALPTLSLSRWSFPKPLADWVSPNLKINSLAVFFGGRGRRGPAPLSAPPRPGRGRGALCDRVGGKSRPRAPPEVPRAPPPFPPQDCTCDCTSDRTSAIAAPDRTCAIAQLHQVQSSEALYWIETTNRRAILQSNFNPKCSWPDWNWN